jgi:hypothetical protein
MPDKAFGPYRHLTFRISTSPSGADSVVVDPSGDFKITREPGTDDAFYFRDKLSGPLTFREADYALLLGIEQSTDRCQDLYLLLDIRSYAGGPIVYTWVGTFTCNECEFIRPRCQVKVSPLPADGYQKLFEDWDRPVNLLAARNFNPVGGDLRTVKAELGTLPTGQAVEFKRIGNDVEADYVGVDGWAPFLRNTSYIRNGRREEHLIVFHYVLKGLLMEPDELGSYEPRDLSDQGWQFYTRNDTISPPTADYVKTPEIAGFKPYVIGTFDDWWHTEGGRRPKYGETLLVLPCGQKPSDFGFANAGYIEVTGPDPTGANNSPQCASCLNLRRTLRNDNCKSLWWKFGQFSFKRCFPLLDGLYHLLLQTAPQLLPPRPEDLSSFFTHPVNPVTKSTGVNNELPTLLLSAGSDVKRYGASEPATRLLISLKQFVEDICAMFDLGYFVDSGTGLFRIEHRSFFESQPASVVLDLRPTGEFARTANLTDSYTYRNEKLPKYEQLQITAAMTEEFEQGISFGEGEIEYSGACVNRREGQNTNTRTVSRLTGDIAGLVLSGDALPDSCIVVLSVEPDGSLREGNRRVSASQLLLRYHRHGRS